MDRVKGKVAIVTGGANGIGEAAAKLLANEGAGVAIIDIDDGNGKRVAEEIISAGGDAVYGHADITSEEEVSKAFADFYERFGKLHILVNNAGVAGMREPAHKASIQDFDRIMNVNLKGTLICTKYAVPYILKTGPGSVVNVCSIYGIVASDVPIYDTSKGAMRAMTKSDAILYSRDNIRFNSVHPGNIRTPLFEKLVDEVDPQGLDHAVYMLSVTNPLNRMGTPDDIAYGILYLASDESSYVNGTELVIDGGFINMPFPVYETNTADWTTLDYYDKLE
ncbi:MAG: SDR family oxidoreductase [Dehalococcoidales bacterium]|nr:MAG: SDR family oxidoreductase [Dehalococcoidales bacterium]